MCERTFEPQIPSRRSKSQLLANFDTGIKSGDEEDALLSNQQNDRVV